GSFTRGDRVRLKADRENRENTCENHSATHLLQKALRVVLGTHVEQAGSLNNADRLRFDFTHFQAMSAEEIRRVEELVNEEIKAALPVVTKEMSVDEARKMGAMALFGEKYGSVVRVVSMGDFSIELCGGTHVSNTRDIGTFKILSESGISAGVRRIEAITGDRVLHYYRRLENELKETAASLKTSPAELPNRIRSLQEELKRTQAENEELKAKIAAKEAKDVLGSAETVGDFRILTKTVQGMTADEMRTLADTLKDKLGDGLIVLASVQNGAVTLLAAATDGAVKRGAHAGNIIKNIAPLVKGGGGGRPNMAQAGGKDPSGIDEAFLKAREVFSEQVK
ncbi:MAG: alanine--tRNA ligase, partial [Lachnospiraceae bacterium]|nr:alanine--tRNA ligase [Lachnospiraceae bacterium]